jgi:predicted TPR repeat methyltransferase
VDWGCGDGAAALVFAAAGWAVHGIDQAEPMLRLATERAQLAGVQATWQHGDLRTAVVERPAQLATAFYDTLNYLISLDDLRAGWRMIAQSLAPGGYAIADVNTAYEYASAWIGQHAIVADTDDVFVVNRLRYNARTGLARGRIVWFVREPGSDDWRRGAETHLQRAHTDDELCEAITQAGLQLVERHTPHGAAPSATATRLIYIAQKR